MCEREREREREREKERERGGSERGREGREGRKEDTYGNTDELGQIQDPSSNEVIVVKT